jgi:transposase-like protein
MSESTEPDARLVFINQSQSLRLSADLCITRLYGEHLADRCVVVALAITADGTKLPVGLWEGATENKTVVTAWLADLVSRGLSVEDGCWSC